jgi:biopolymer transport protein TolR
VSGRRHRTHLVHKAAKNLEGVRAEINVTPLVDVCLVLLIIFMMVTDKLTRGMEVPLPKAKNFAERRDTGEELIVSIMRNPGSGRVELYWDRKEVPNLVALKAIITEEFRRGSRPLFVKASEDLTYGDVYPVLMGIHEAGSPGVQLGIAELKTPGAN